MRFIISCYNDKFIDNWTWIFVYRKKFSSKRNVPKITKIFDDNNKEGGWITKMNPTLQISKIFVPLFHLLDDHGFEHIRKIHQIQLN